ncbi:DUF262 domain-containing protein [Brachyspira intermedia]|uniref:DUF262 domain-containing protein n=1 Tax=Brachyspira intermedia TaxID=84377 RepID=UPI003003FF4F
MSETTNQGNDIIESVKEIFSNGRIYNIPEYQRGYKWSEKDVNALLNDIDNFKVDEKDNSKFYCLQNITIKKQNDNIYEVIDGQQRLTTLSILLSYLGETNLLNKIQYSIREESGNFLYELLKEKKIDYLNDKLEYINDFDRNYDIQDVFHFCLAKHTIIEFFNKNENKNKENDFRDKLLKNVKLIVNDVSSGNDVKGETIFKNLNSNKVALEYYDLIRAIFITRVNSNENKEESPTTILLNNAQLILNYLDNGNNAKAETIFISKAKEANDIDLAEKRIKIGIDIDNMNIWWSDENVKEYFKMFSNENNISILYDLYWKCRNNESNNNNNNNNNNEKSNAYKAQSNNEALFKYLDTNTDKAEVVFKEVVRFHNTMTDWYEDKEIYHLLGFIGEHIEKDINTIWSIWEKNTTREDFKNKLKQIIKDELIKNIEIKDNDDEKDPYKNYLESIKDTNKNWYEEEEMKKNTIKLLVLMDIIKILNNKDIKHKLPANYFNKNKEDIEHIFSKTPNDKTTIKDAIYNIDFIIKSFEKYKDELCESLTNKATIKDYIEEKLKPLNELNSELNKKEDKEKTTLKDIGKLEDYQRFIRDVPHINSIGNLVLLNLNTNRSYGNNPYIEKRMIIIEQHESGEKYIRNHTWSIFSKNIKLKDKTSIDTVKLDEWTIKDIEITAKYIKEKIKEFFNGIE